MLKVLRNLKTKCTPLARSEQACDELQGVLAAWSLSKFLKSEMWWGRGGNDRLITHPGDTIE